MNYLFGGSFDPVTIAHEQIIQYLLNNILKEDDNLLILPNGDDYHFNGKLLTNYNIRRQMLESVTKDHRYHIIDLLNEQKFMGIYQILEKLNHPIYVIGSDLLETISTWIEPIRLLENNQFLVINREGYDVNQYFNGDSLLRKYQKHFILTDLTIANISSSNIRNHQLFTQVSANIYQIIVKNNLYQNTH